MADPRSSTAMVGPSIGETHGAGRGVPQGRQYAWRGGRGGWDQMRARIPGDGERPMLFVSTPAGTSLGTVPALGHDPDRPEDSTTRRGPRGRRGPLRLHEPAYSTPGGAAGQIPPDLGAARRGRAAGNWKAVLTAARAAGPRTPTHQRRGRWRRPPTPKPRRPGAAEAACSQRCDLTRARGPQTRRCWTWTTMTH